MKRRIPLTSRRIELDYNAPFILSFSLACALAYFAAVITRGWVLDAVFSIGPNFSFARPLTWPGLLLHPLGHESVQHLSINLAVILLIGPLIEEKYGTVPLLGMALVTALLTGLISGLFFAKGLMGASGIAFMLIVLSSFTNVRAGTVPLTFVLVVLLYLGNEFITAFRDDDISQFAHIMGGLCGGWFGYRFGRS